MARIDQYFQENGGTLPEIKQLFNYCNPMYQVELAENA